MGFATATIEMQSPEQHRERLHDVVKATRTVLVLSRDTDDRGEPIIGRPMELVRTDDDTTMYVATWLDTAQATQLARDPRVTVAVQGACSALFDAEVTVSRDRKLIETLASEWRKRWGRWADPLIAILVISPIEGAYWEGPQRHAYQYRFDAAPVAVQRERSDGVSAL